MAGNTFGRALRLTTFGESHGAGLGGIIDGCPAGLELTEAHMQAELDRRKPGQGPNKAIPQNKLLKALLGKPTPEQEPDNKT